MSNEESLQQVAEIKLGAERLFMQRVEDLGKITNTISALWKLVGLGVVLLMGAMGWILSTQSRLTENETYRQQNRTRIEGVENAIQREAEARRLLDNRVTRLEWELSRQ